jgi:hypothetical protein
MDTDNRSATGQASNHAVPQPPRSYNFLLRLSRRLGTVATKSSFLQNVGQFMNQEITLKPSEHMFGTPRLSLERRLEQQDTRGGVQQKPANPANPAVGQVQKARDLKKIVKRSQEVLMTANTVFPITIFPDTVTVDRTKVTINRRDFFWTSDVISFRIEDILNVSASVGPLFGSLTIASRVMSTVDHFQIKHLWRNDAFRLKHIIQGYVIAQHNSIDTAHLNTKELIDTLVELGSDYNST